MWAVFHDDEVVEKITKKHFDNAIHAAILSINAQLQRPYDLASSHRTSDYREILWATADSESMIRNTDHIFKSYLRIHEQLYGNSPPAEHRPLPRNKFSSRLSNLKKPNYGQIVENHVNRRSLLSYRENILRGYVALKALEAGIELRGDVPDEPKAFTVTARERREFAVGKDWTPKVKFRGEN